MKWRGSLDLRYSVSRKSSQIDIFVLHQTKKQRNEYGIENSRAEAGGYHPASLAVAWAASNSAVTAPIIGGGNTQQLMPSLESVNILVDDELKSEIDKISPPPPPATDRTEEQTKFNYSAILEK